MSSTMESTFMTLPTTLQLDILKLLPSWEHQRNFRMVCRHALSLINYLGLSFQLKVNGANPSSYEQLKTSPFSSIATIEISNLSQPLQIYSSSRFQIPKANDLRIGRNVSVENFLKLTRYYAKCCKILVFFDTDFPSFKKSRMFGSSHCLATITELSLYFRFQNGLHQRLHGLGYFFDWASLPALEKLKIEILPHPLVVGDLSPNNKCCINFPKFFLKHVKQIKHLYVFMPSIMLRQIIINHFELMINVQHLFIRDFGDPFESIDHDTIIKAFKNFINLKLLRMNFKNRDELLGVLVTNNKNTFKTLVVHNVVPSLSWLYKIECFSRLKFLSLGILFTNSGIFDEAPENFKLKTLRILSICISHHSGVEWFESFINWMFKIMPDLQMLYLNYHTGPNDRGTQPRIVNILALINEMPNLDRIRFPYYYYGIRFVEGGGIEEGLPKTCSPEIEEWLKQNPEIRHEREVDGCIVYINHPFIHHELKAEEA